MGRDRYQEARRKTMADLKSETLTARQKAWFASIRSNLERETGRSLEDWVVIARGAPEGTMRQRVAWMKAEHGLGANRATTVLSQAFPSDMGWEQPDRLRTALWTDPASMAILLRVETLVAACPDLITGQRKGFTAWSRNFQFAALRPLRGGRARLGLALEPVLDARLEPARKEGWSERLKSALVLADLDEANDELASLISAAWRQS